MKKFEFTVPEKYNDVIKWKERATPFDIYNKEARKFLTELSELRNLRNSEQDKWLTENQNKLLFKFHFEDLGVVFVEVLIVTDSEGNIVYERCFYENGEAEKYLDRIGIVSENRND